MIGQHPQLIGLPETNLFARDNYKELRRLYSVRPRFAHGLLRAIAELGLGAEDESNVETARAWLEEHPETSTAELFADLREWASPQGLVDKSPVHVYNRESLQRIDRAAPDAFYLHLSRHPRGTCESIYALRQETNERSRKAQRVQRRFGKRGQNDQTIRVGQGDTELTPENMWLNPHMNILEFLDGIPPKRQLLMQGEELLADPDTGLRRIAHWMGISASDQAIEAMKHPENSPFARFGPRNALLGNDPSFLESPGLRPYRPKPSDLKAPLSWDSQLTFSDELRGCATFFGYTS